MLTPQDDVPDRSAPQHVVAAARVLQIDFATVEVVALLRDAGVEAILLKGPSFARWLYDDPGERPYTDTDLLVAPESLAAARATLKRHGFTAPLTGGGHELIYYAEPWIRDEDGATVDLHHRLPGISDSTTAWLALAPRTTTMTLRGHEVTVLDEVARLLHVVLHAAQHGTARTPSLTDLERALARVDRPVWEAAAELARETGAAAAFRSGLELVPAGRDVLDGLGVGDDGGAWQLAEILRREQPGEAMVQGLVWLGNVRGLRAKARLVVFKVFPPRAALAAWSPLAARGRAGLLVARVWRPLWLLLRAPRAVAGYRKARRLQRERRATP